MLTDAATETIAQRIVYLEQRARSRMAEWLELVGEFDRRDAHRGSGFRTAADWLAFACRLTPRTARDHVRVARRLIEWPQVAAAFAEARLSYAQVRALSRAAVEEDQQALLKVALSSTAADLERHVRQLRSSASADLDVANAGHAKRFVKYFVDHDDGSLRFFGRLSADDGRALVEALETGAEAMHPPEPGDPSVSKPGWRPPLLARRADALAELVAGTAPRAQVVLHVDPEALACTARRDEPRAGETCALRDGPAIPSELARRLACDADVSVAGMNLGRTQRVVSAAQRRALEARDGRRCAFPGCDRRHGLAAHHLRHWAHGGRTDLDNMVLLCRFHHRLVHDDGFVIRRRRDGTLRVTDPGGRELQHLPSRASPQPVAA